jgi:hypothetical protein
MCEKNSKAATLSRSKLHEAPKDIKVLEVLRPSNAPTMKERYEMAIAKERRLESASQPELSQAAKEKARKEKEALDKKKKEEKDAVDKKKNGKKKKNKMELNEYDLKNVEALEEDDEVQDGINWSESEEEDEDMDNNESN